MFRKRQAMTQKEIEQQAIEKARRLGVSQYATFDGHRTDTAELQKRIWQAERERRDARLWWIALLSCIASVLAALAAWYAVTFAR